MSSSRLSALAPFLFLLVARTPLLRVAGQIAYDCPSSLDYLKNADGQDPCHVTSSLFGQCTGTHPYNLTALGDQYSGYAGPTDTSQAAWTYNGCLCSMPIYNLVMACQDCQGKAVGNWAGWTASCNSSFTGSTDTPTQYFPQPVPEDTVIPPWATIDNSEHPWSEAQAQANVTGNTSTSTTGSTTSATSSATTSSAPAASSSHTGAIVGGVVGGVAVIAALAGAGWMLLRRSQKRGGWSSSGASSNRMSIAPTATPASHHQVRPYDPPYGHGYHGTPDRLNPTPGESQGYHSSSEGGGNPWGPNSTSPGYSHAGSSSHTGGQGPSSYLPEVQTDDLHRPDQYPAFPGART